MRPLLLLSVLIILSRALTLNAEPVVAHADHDHHGPSLNLHADHDHGPSLNLHADHDHGPSLNPHAAHDHGPSLNLHADHGPIPDPHAVHDHQDHGPLPPGPELPTAPPAPAGQSLYICPMHPNIVRAEPANCPLCGMALEPIKQESSSGSVAVSPAIRQSLGITTALAAPSTLARNIDTLGEVRWDERKLVHIHSRASGWLERLVASNSGDFVNKGELLYEIYAPDLVAAQNDFLNALTVIKRDSSARSLHQRARLRLELLGMSNSQIDRLEKTGDTFYRLPIYAPAAGYITELAVRQGMYVSPETSLMQLADRSSVFVVVQVFGEQIPWLQSGMQAEVDLTEAGVLKRPATIDLLYPELDRQTRAQQVRLVLDNPDGKLRAGMLARVRLAAAAHEVAVAIPRQALISSGTDNRVVVQTSDERFVVMPVEVGLITPEQVEIVRGLNAGERVVTSGQFLLDAEAQLQAAAARMSQTPAATAPHAHHH